AEDAARPRLLRRHLRLPRGGRPPRQGAEGPHARAEPPRRHGPLQLRGPHPRAALPAAGAHERAAGAGRGGGARGDRQAEAAGEVPRTARPGRAGGAMSRSDWVDAFRAQAEARGDRERLWLADLPGAAGRFLETDPDVALGMFREGRQLAARLHEPWWA